MRRVQLHILISIAITIMLALSSCSDQRRLRLGKPLKPRSTAFLVNKLDKNELVFDWIAMKLDVDVLTNGEKQGFKSTVRIKKDSMIWISITPLLGVEAAKVVITPDSVKYLSKIPGDKHYFIGDFNSLKERFDAPLDFFTIQNMLVGNAISIDKKRDFKSRVDDRLYLLVSEFTRKLKKVTGVDEKEVNPEDSVKVDIGDKKLERVMKRADEGDLIFQRYWLNGETFKLERTLIDDLQNKRTVEIQHSEFDEHEGQLIPSNTRLKLSGQEGATVVDVEIIRLKLNKAYDMPFDIPEDYERRYY